MVSNQHRTRERYIKLLPQTQSPEVDYSLFIMVTMLVMSERLEKQLGMALAAFPLQSLQVQPLFHGFVFLHHLLMRTPWGVFL
jgi:hypothetical protein